MKAFLSKTVTSIQMKAHEVCVKPLKPWEKILFIEDSDDEENEEVIDLQQTLQSISDEEHEDLTLLGPWVN